MQKTIYNCLFDQKITFSVFKIEPEMPLNTKFDNKNLINITIRK